MCAFRGVLNEVLYGEALPRGPTPYPFILHFWQKREPFCIPSVKKWHTLTYLVENFVSLLKAYMYRQSIEYERITNQDVF